MRQISSDKFDKHKASYQKETDCQSLLISIMGMIMSAMRMIVLVAILIMVVRHTNSYLELLKIKKQGVKLNLFPLLSNIYSNSLSVVHRN